MKDIPYSYAILSYVPDPAAGEQINVGVLVFAPQSGNISAFMRLKPLDGIFAGFDAKTYRAFAEDFKEAVITLNRDTFLGGSRVKDNFQTVQDLARYIVPDNGLAFQFGGFGAGVTEDVDREFTRLQERFVLSLRPQEAASSS